MVTVGAPPSAGPAIDGSTAFERGPFSSATSLSAGATHAPGSPSPSTAGRSGEPAPAEVAYRRLAADLVKPGPRPGSRVLAAGAAVDGRPLLVMGTGQRRHVERMPGEGVVQHDQPH